MPPELPAGASSEPAVTSDAATLGQVSEALGLGLSEHQIAQLIAYRDLLLRWNQTYNLTSIREPQRALQQHVVDCVAVLPALRRELAQDGDGVQLLDVGSGGGLPGLVIGMLEPRVQVTCLDAVAKKAAFVRQAIVELGLVNCEAVHARVEQHRFAPGYRVITSRAFASLLDFTGWTRHLLAPEKGVWVAMKGVEPTAELQALDASRTTFHVEHITWPGNDSQRCLIWMRPPP
ncbi:MAG: 16S rRNA (guanine(527)-N(7))-methyltransferase RsmG [Rubrivivax sp.]|nr:16S rRNA (guanine(527)-N(7))-methyltransferase RsmG [Rubrivivax sp.]